MARPIKEVSREERLIRAIMALESLAECEDHESNPFPGKVYMIAHAATARCSSVCNDWISMVEDCEKAAKEQRLYDIDKILARLMPPSEAKLTEDAP